MVKKNDGIKESTDSTNTIEEDGEYILKASEYDQEMPQSQVADQPMAPEVRHRIQTATQLKLSNQLLSLPQQDNCRTRKDIKSYTSTQGPNTQKTLEPRHVISNNVAF